MKTFGIIFSISLVLPLISIALRIIRFSLKEIWDIEEFTGLFWRFLERVDKICLSVFIVIFSVEVIAFLGFFLSSLLK